MHTAQGLTEPSSRHPFGVVHWAPVLPSVETVTGCPASNFWAPRCESHSEKNQVREICIILFHCEMFSFIHIILIPVCHSNCWHLLKWNDCRYYRLNVYALPLEDRFRQFMKPSIGEDRSKSQLATISTNRA